MLACNRRICCCVLPESFERPRNCVRIRAEDRDTRPLRRECRPRRWVSSGEAGDTSAITPAAQTRQAPFQGTHSCRLLESRATRRETSCSSCGATEPQKKPSRRKRNGWGIPTKASLQRKVRVPKSHRAQRPEGHTGHRRTFAIAERFQRECPRKEECFRYQTAWGL